MHIFFHSGFPNWYIVMRGQTYGRGKQVYSYNCHIFVDKTATIVTTIPVYIKHISGLKIILEYHPQKYIRKNIFYY